jgi:hypothetical protein
MESGKTGNNRELSGNCAGGKYLAGRLDEVFDHTGMPISRPNQEFETHRAVGEYLRSTGSNAYTF